MKEGKVWLVGAGPSDEGLFTLKGKEVLSKADVVVYDNLVGQGILQMIPENAVKIDVGKKAGNHKVIQEDTNQILLEKAREGNRVVRLKGGDPFLFGRGGEELELLVEHNIPFEVVPGITSAISVPAYAGIPVTHRDYTSSLHIITAHRKRGNNEPINYKSLVGLDDATFVFLMGIGELENICNGLIEAGMNKNMPAAILEKGTSSKQRRVVGDLSTLPSMAKQHNIGTPGIIVVGEVCTLSEKFHWAEDRVLGGARIFITRPKAKNSYVAQRLYELGAEVIKLPSIRTVPLNIEEEWSNVEKNLLNYEWIVFTSDVAVDYFFDHLNKIQKDIRKLSHLRFAAVGSATKKAIENRGVLVEYMPERYYGKALGEGLVEKVTKGKKVLAFSPKDVVSDCAIELNNGGIRCDIIELYETIALKGNDIPLTKDDMVVFTSASTVKGFVQTMSHCKFTEIKAICIGEKTANEAIKYGMDVIISKEATMDSLVDKVVEVYRK